MRALILAAGEGTRLRPYTADRPKCLVTLAGRALLRWQLNALQACGITDITVVTGYRGRDVAATGIPTLHNARYMETNMVCSLMTARTLLDGAHDVLIAYGDLVYETRIVRALAACNAPLAITVDTGWRRLWDLRMTDPLSDAETLRLDAADHVIELGRRPTGFHEIQAQFMGLLRVAAELAPRLVAAYDALDAVGPYDGRTRDTMFMTSFLQYLIDHACPVTAVRVDGGWLEVDTADDLDRYEALASQGLLGAFCALPE